MRIRELGLSTRASNAVQGAIATHLKSWRPPLVRDLAGLTKEDLSRVGLGKSALQELCLALAKEVVRLQDRQINELTAEIFAAKGKQ